MKIGSKDDLEIVDQITDHPPRMVVMNPPYTSWTNIGLKFDKQLQKTVRDRMARIWDGVAKTNSILNSKKSSIASLFQSLAINVIRGVDDGVIALIQPLDFRYNNFSKRPEKSIGRVTSCRLCTYVSRAFKF